MTAKTESANRRDGGYFVQGCAIHRADHVDGEGPARRIHAHGGLVAFFSRLWVEANPAVPWEIANFLNDRAKLPRVNAPAKAVKAARENRRVPA
jgi:hypothetical protein